VLLWALLAGCATNVIDTHRKVADWPELTVIEHHVAEAEMREQCSRFVEPWQIAAGCTLFLFDAREAHLFLSRDFPDPDIREHELLHAAGYDHIGSDYMHNAWLDWKAQRQRAGLKEDF